MNHPYETYSERAKRALILAQAAALGFNHPAIGTEHLLVGLVREEQGLAARVLGELGAGPDRLPPAVEAVLGRGAHPIAGDLALTPPTERVLHQAVEEARHLGHAQTGTGHLLLALVDECDGSAAGVLAHLGLERAAVRTAVLQAIAQTAVATPDGPGAQPQRHGAPLPGPAVRFATATDLDFTVHTTYVAADRMRQLVAQGQVAVAEVAGERVGYACLDWLVVMAPFLGVIWVHKAHRRRGIGTALLHFLEAALRERGHDMLYSSCVIDEVEPQAWHRRVGFRECGLIAEFNDGGRGEVLLRKSLHADEP